MRNRIGRLRWRIALLKPQSTPGEGGGLETTWSVTSEVWANIHAVAQRDGLAADADRAVVRLSVTLRWRNDIVIGMRISHDGRLWQIRSLDDEDGNRLWLTCNCEEVVG